VVAGAIRPKVVFFLTYRGRHPQSVEAVLGRILILSIALGFLFLAFAIIDKEMRYLKFTIRRRRAFVVAEVIRLKAVFFPACRGRHPQSVEAVLAGFLIHSRYLDLFSSLPKALVKSIRRIHLFNIYSKEKNSTKFPIKGTQCCLFLIG